MNLLFERRQSAAVFTFVPLRLAGGVMFTLWVKAELDEEETELMARYKFRDALLVVDETGTTLGKSFRASLLIGFVVWLIAIIPLSWSGAASVATLTVAVMTAIYYNELREKIYVRDLIHGRKFRCFSIVELIRKEQYLTTLSAYLRQVLESAKHWDGREVLEVPALKPEQAKQLVIEGL